MTTGSELGAGGEMPRVGQPRPHPPLHRFSVLRSSDVDLVEATANRLFSPHRLVPHERRPLDAKLHSVDVGALSFIYIECGAAVRIDTLSPLDYFAVNLTLRGSASVHLHSSDVTTNTSSAIVFSPTEHLDMSWTRDLQQLCVKISAQALREQARRMTATPLRHELRFRPSLADPAAASSWWQTVRLVEATLHRSGGRVASPLLARQLEQMVMTTLLLQQPHTWLEQLLEPTRAASLPAVRLATELINDAPEEGFTVPDLAQRTGVSVRALQEGFRRQHGMSPTEYLANARLDRARVLIEHGQPIPLQVSDVAYRSGFMHLGRFSQNYRQRFGISPSEALRQRKLSAASG